MYCIKIRQRWPVCVHGCVRVIAIRNWSLCSERSKSPARCLRSGTNAEGPKGITGASWWRTPLINVLVLDNVRKKNLWDLFSEADLFTFSLFLLLLILFGVLFPLTPLFQCKLYLFGGSEKTSWLIRPEGYWSNWSSAVTPDLVIDSTAYNEASEQRPRDRGFFGEGHLWGEKETQGDE